jgi:hypothetical protein
VGPVVFQEIFVSFCLQTVLALTILISPEALLTHA